MDFFDSQERARKRTKLLVFYFVLAVLSIIALLYAGLIGLGVSMTEHSTLWQPDLLLAVAVGVVLLISFGSGYKTLQLSAGGSAVAEELGGRPVPPSTTDPGERRLVNVVEEMALASGTPVPKIYLLDRESGINAFAAGRTTNDAAVGVTRGCVDRLTRDELQGVIAHEFSHILNGDMRLSTRLIGILHGILLLTILGRVLLRIGFSSSGGGSKKEGGALPVAAIGLVLILAGAIGVFFGKLIKSAVSRQREFLADASAVQFTRNPTGIAGALMKIGGASSRIENPNAEEASHLFFSNGMSRSFMAMFATHPPLPIRIQAVLPSWDGKFLKPEALSSRSASQPAQPQSARPPLLPRLPGTEAVRIPGMENIPVIGQGAFAAALLGTPPPLPGAAPEVAAGTLAFAICLRETLSGLIDIHDTPTAMAAALSLLISKDADIRRRQLDLLAAQGAPGVAQLIGPVLAAIDSLNLERKLPLLDLLLPALREMSPQQYTRFSENIHAAIEMDGQIDLFEFAMQRVLRRRLDAHFQKTASRPPAQHTRATDLKPEIRLLLSALAWVGSGDDAETAFRTAINNIEGADDSWGLIPARECGLDAIDSALEALAQARPNVLKNFLYAAARLVIADGEVRPAEWQLLRAIAESVDVPVPPFVSFD